MFTGAIMALPFAEHAIELIVVAPISAKFAMAYLAFLSSALGFVFWSYALDRLAVYNPTIPAAIPT